MKEIGSEFWEDSQGNGRCFEKQSKCNEYACVLSGRTAIDFIIRDICDSRKLRSIMIPSYCCDSMIEPFIRNGVKVLFYNVNAERIEYPCNDCDAVLLLEYFGYEDIQIQQIAEAARKKGQIIIYDSTHRLNETYIDADYIFCSYRKWFYCNYAIVKKRNGAFSIPVPVIENDGYISKRNRAAELKQTYIELGIGDKNSFLSLFSAAEEQLESDYVNYTGECRAVDIQAIIQKRRANAEHLIHGLCEVKEIKIWKPQVKKNDTPLFVPILVQPETRHELRQYLISKKIYCPIHWPLTGLHGLYHEIFDEELSLICDQRYSFEDIDQEISVIKEFFIGDK